MAEIAALAAAKAGLQATSIRKVTGRLRGGRDEGRPSSPPVAGNLPRPALFRRSFSVGASRSSALAAAAVAEDGKGAAEVKGERRPWWSRKQVPLSVAEEEEDEEEDDEEEESEEGDEEEKEKVVMKRGGVRVGGRRKRKKGAKKMQAYDLPEIPPLSTLQKLKEGMMFRDAKAIRRATSSSSISSSSTSSGSTFSPSPRGKKGRRGGGSQEQQQQRTQTLQQLVMEGADRFNLLLLEEGEYYFKDYACNYHPQGGSQRIPGHLKVCSASLFFVPKSQLEPVFRIPLISTEGLDCCAKLPGVQQPSTRGEPAPGFMVVESSERIDVKIGNRYAPYMRHTGEFKFHFAFHYTSAESVLPRVQQLLDIVHGAAFEQQAKLSAIIQAHEEEVRFNPGWLEDPDERVALELVGNQVMPLVSQPGRVILTSWSVYFQTFNVVSSAPVVRHPLDKVTSVMKRTIHLQELGVELFFGSWSSVYFMFKTEGDCQKFYLAIQKQPGLSLEIMKTRREWMRDWIRGKVSNFDYLMYLNRESNRSFNDLSQYPVFPWVLQDYTSSKLDLNNPVSFRDLSKPVGALNPSRLEKFKERYEELAELYDEWAESFPEGEVPPHVPGTPSPPFLYGCHYSTPGYVVFFRVRSDPQLMLRLQNGRFDMPDRLLSSIQEIWEGAYNNPTDLKELIPEFYSLSPSFLINSKGIDFGTKQDGEVVNDVLLPPWANDAEDFCRKMRDALESPHVSRRLHQWIDLVFGHKQRGEEAIKADNVFHSVTYDDVGSKIMECVLDDTVKQAIRVQMREFGRTPKALFSTPHPVQMRREIQAFRRAVRSASRSMRLHHLRAIPAAILSGGSSKDAAHSTFARSSSLLRSVLSLQRKGSRGAGALEAGGGGRGGRFGRYRSILMGALTPLVELALPDRSVYRAISNVASNDEELRKIGLEWLENTAAFREPEMLEVSSAKHLHPLLPLLSSKHDHQRAAAIKALAPLAKPVPNRPFLLQAGFPPHIEAYLERGFTEGTRAAVESVSLLSSLRDFSDQFSRAGVLSLVDLLAMHESEIQVVETQSLACSALSQLCSARRHRMPVASRKGVQRLLPFIKACEHYTVELRENALRALATVCVEEMTQDEFVRQGGLPVVLQVCSEEGGGQLEAAIRLLTSLSTNPELRPVIAAQGGLRVLCNASCAAQPEIQEASAGALINLCSDGVIINSVVKEEGLWSIISMAQSPHAEVQRLAARAFWHLAVHHENKRQVMAMGGLQSLLALSLLGPRNRQATALAEEALSKLAEDDEIRALLMKEEAFASRARAAGGKGDGGEDTSPGETRAPSFAGDNEMMVAIPSSPGSSSGLEISWSRSTSSHFEAGSTAPSELGVPLSPSSARLNEF